jgi:succinate dehydrogenase / fumarate reductase cytochrome b subunit
MSWLTRSLKQSIGKKFVMATTGLFLILFLFEHIIGNFYLFAGAESFDRYVEALESLGYITPILEIFLAAMFIIHIVYGIWLWIGNEKATPIKYEVNGTKENASFTSRNAIYLGLLILVFLIIHIFNFWYHYRIMGYDLYETIASLFKNVWYLAFYIFTFIVLGMHIHHGFQSAFQTLGWNHPKYFPFIKKFGTFLAVVFAVGFSIIPIYFYFAH